MSFCRSFVLCLSLAAVCYGTALPGYTGNPDLGSAYKFHRTSVTWAEASRTCSNEGAELFVINSQEEADFLRNLLRSQGVGSKCWTGMSRSGSSFTSVGGQSLSSSGYSRWKTGPTAENSNNNCVIMWTCGRYSDRPCSEQHPFICEQLYYQNAVLNSSEN